MPSPRGVSWRQSLQLNHRHKFVSDQFGGHDAAGVQRIAQRDTDKPGQRIEDVAEDLLEA